MSDVPSADELLDTLVPAPEGSEFRLAVIAALHSNGTGKVTFDGESAASDKQYAYLSSYQPQIGDRVLMAAISGTYIIIGKISYNVAPDSGGGGDGAFASITVSGLGKLGSLQVTGATTLAALTATTVTASGQVKGGSAQITGESDLRGTVRVGSSSSSLVGFYGATPRTKQTVYYATATDTQAKLNALILALANSGLLTASN